MEEGPAFTGHLLCSGLCVTVLQQASLPPPREGTWSAGEVGNVSSPTALRSADCRGLLVFTKVLSA